MNAKGQLFSIDFLAAMALLVLLVGTLVTLGINQASEQQAQRVQNELQQTASNAAALLSANPQLTCALCANFEDTDTVCDAGEELETNVNNCIDWTKTIEKNDLGLSPEFDFRIQTQSGTFLPKGNTLPSDSRDVYALQWKTIIQNGALAKSELYRCLKKLDTCALTDETIVLYIWKTG